MDIDPLEAVPEDDVEDATQKTRDRSRSRLNNLVAITVAILATFLGICKVKDDNIVQAMQQAQADKLDNYNWYQSRNNREETLKAAVSVLTAERAAAAASAHPEFDKQIAVLTAKATEQETKKQKQQDDGDKAGKDYDALNIHDDQFDLSDALIAIAISLLAVTALTQKRWLYALATIPMFGGIVFGLAGLLGWKLHPDFLTKLLS